ncbi:MAG: SusC/RagA family TonB-linked outer membrane protein [Cytophagales bacterium]|nr:SusC/RagA family TonB-linked outer membrane protein [Cytophagales bacterium]
MKRKLLFSLLFSFCAIASVFAQRTVSGSITSAEDGSTIPGVNVVLKGTTTGTTSDLDGNYRLTVPDEGGVLIFSFIGLVSQEAEIGSRSVIDVAMTSDVQELETVVVTALGIERESRSLGYSVSGVKSDELVKARETNILNALQGKVTGVRIGRSSGNLGSSSKITIRGVSSLAGRNNPLWVVDGVPISNAQDASTSRIAGNRDFGNNAGLLNPDDIESINVLKGGAAAALYGSRAGAGVIVVTTKKGKKSASGAPTVNFSTSFRVDEIFKVPDFQNGYSTGTLGKYDSSFLSTSWGEPIQGQIRRNNILGIDEPLQTQDENYKDFFHNGLTFINNLSIADADERGDYRLSITSLNQEGILPGANLDRLTTSLNAGFNHSKNLKSRFSAQFVRSINRGVGVQGANDPNIFGIANFGRSIDFKDFQDWADDNGNQVGIIEQSTNNPYWTRRENQNDQKVSRFLGNYSIDYSPIDNLTFKGRVGYDFVQDNRFIANAKGTLGRVNGDFQTDNINRRQLTIDGIANYNIPVNEDININILGGIQYNERIFEQETNFAQDLVIAGLFQTANAANNSPDRGFSEIRLYGVFGEAEFSYKNWLTLTATARNDWSSTLPLDNNSYFYPSISAAFVFTDAFQISNNILSYGKFRASWANIGNDAVPYQADFRFFPRTTANGQYGLNLTFPYNGVLAFGKTNRFPNQNLVPENKATVEFGFELGFFDGRVGLDATYFNAVTTDQFFPAPIPESTGFATIALNAGEVQNEGIELSLNVDIIQQGDFQWSVNANFFTAESTVKELTEGVDRLLIASAFNSLQVVAEPGKEFQLFGIPFLRDSVSGRPIINPVNGARQAGEARTFGSVFPEWQGGFTNNFSWKGINFGFTIDASVGGLMRSSTVNALWTAGLTEETLRNRQGTFIDLEGVLDNGDGTFRDNDVPVRSAQAYWQSLDDNSIAEATIFDATYVKLREANISYTLPSSWLSNSPIRSITVGFEGRNLALLYSTVPHIDPEANLFGSASDGVGVERQSVASTRSFGFNLRFGF